MDAVPSPSASVIDRLVHHLMVTQKVNMLDTTKCSTTARRVYNYLLGADDAGTGHAHAVGDAHAVGVAANDNLAGAAPNLALLGDALRASPPQGMGFVAYVHFDHVMNDTSHYFIVLCADGRVTLLQSAVFEFSISDWLFPRLKKGGSKPYDSLKDHEPVDERERYFAEQARRELARSEAVLDGVAACRWSSSRETPIDEFVADFLPALASLEGVWNEEDLHKRCETYRALFSCVLPEDALRRGVRTGAFDKPAAVKWIGGECNLCNGV